MDMDMDINMDMMVGKIVRSTGKYNDLYNSSIIRINEAVPIVELSTRPYDKAVFGVISGEEMDDTSHTFNIGNLKFYLDNKIKIKKVMVNSVGEGGIWVCNANGNLSNGDYITTSHIPGYGALQCLEGCDGLEDAPGVSMEDTGLSDDTLRNFTVAKITCDCAFDPDSDIYNCETFEYDSKEYKKAFVGCVYCC
jgi:hypothetical protein